MKSTTTIATYTHTYIFTCLWLFCLFIMLVRNRIENKDTGQSHHRLIMSGGWLAFSASLRLHAIKSETNKKQPRNQAKLGAARGSHQRQTDTEK